MIFTSLEFLRLPNIYSTPCTTLTTKVTMIGTLIWDQERLVVNSVSCANFRTRLSTKVVNTGKVLVAEKEKGTVIIFPSYLLHR
jgi:hypothetical protein